MKISYEEQIEDVKNFYNSIDEYASKSEIKQLLIDYCSAKNYVWIYLSDFENADEYFTDMAIENGFSSMDAEIFIDIYRKNSYQIANSDILIFDIDQAEIDVELAREGNDLKK